jgi:putative chitobiose transport system permease protein
MTAVAVVLGMVFILPAIWILVGSLRPSEEIFGSLYPLSWRMMVPSQVSLNSYVELLRGEFGQRPAQFRC